MALASTAAIAGTTAVAAYLDAKYHIAKDVRWLWRVKRAEREYAQAVKNNRQSCFNFFEEVIPQYPEALAIWSREKTYTWREIQDRVHQYAAYFLKLGVRPGQLVAFYLKNSPDYMIAWLGLWAIGCAPALINWNLTGVALVHCLQVSGAAVVLVDEEEGCQRRFNGEREKIEEDLHMKIIALSDDVKREIATLPALRPDDSYRENVKGDSPVGLFYTSGTTGLSKACAFSTSRLYLQATYRGTQYGQTPGPNGDRWYDCMPLYHGTGGVTALVNLLGGVALAIGKSFSTRTFWPDIRDSESTAFVYVGETARYLLAAPPSPLDKQHKIRLMHGNGLRPDVWERFRARFGVEEVAEFFSSTEGVFATVNWCRGPYLANAVGHHGALVRLVNKNVIVPVALDYAVGDILRSPVTGFATRTPYTIGGEILVAVPNEAVFAGYKDAPEATSKRFARNVFRKGDLYYRSGDALRRTDDGRWFFLDRLGDTYRWKSENVSTAEVAEVLSSFPGILEANVYGVLVPDHDGRAGCAAVLIAPEAREKFDWTALARYARTRLSSQAVPVFVRAVEGELGGMGSHNNKQNKGPLREEGVDPGLQGKQVKGGEEDKVWWIPPRGEVGEGGYVPFGVGEWQGLVGGRYRL